MIITFLIIVIVFAILFIMIFFLKGLKEKKGEGKKTPVQRKGKSAVIKEAEKKLSHDPHNVDALRTLGEIYKEDGNWEKVADIYKTLYDLTAVHVELNQAEMSRNMGIAYFNLDKYDEAINAFMLSGKKDPNNFDTNFYLGKSFLQRDVLDKAAICFKKCRTLSPENPEVVLLLGESLFKAQKYRDCLPFLKQALDLNPGNKEILFNMAVAMTEVGMGDKALKFFTHLRPDPIYGPQACLESGKLNERVKNFKAAIQDYEIGMKLPEVPDQIMTQIRYRCGTDYIAMNDIEKGLVYLKQIYAVNPGYKDVESLVTRYSELNQNKNLQIYLLSGSSDFVALCRKLIASYHSKSIVKIDDISVSNEFVEVLCFVQNSKVEAKELFRFYRTTSVIGDIYVREFHAKLRDTKSDSGYCITMGEFSDSSHKYVEGRPIDLIEKAELTKMLKKISLLN